MTTDRAFAVRISFFNGLIFCVATGLSTYADSRFSTNQRFYPLGYWVLLFGVMIFVANYMLLSAPRMTGKAVRVIASILPVLLIGCPIAVLNFDRHILRGGMCQTFYLLAVITTMATWLHLSDATRGLLHGPPSAAAPQVEWIKEATSFWRTAAISGACLAVGFSFAYAAYIVSLSGKDPASTMEDRALYRDIFAARYVLVLSYVLAGPVYECVLKARQLHDLLWKPHESTSSVSG